VTDRAEEARAKLRELWSDLDALAAMSDEEVHAEFRKLGWTDEQVAALDHAAEAFVERLLKEGRP
jgi:hypothetical protein